MDPIHEFLDIDPTDLSDLENKKLMRYHPMDEGINHINIYSKSAIEVGRQLSNFYKSEFTIDGETFQSVEGYWYWLKTGKKIDILKRLVGFQAKQIGRIYPKIQYDGFNEKIKEAIKLKIENNQSIKENLTNSSLPFTHYYVHGTIKNPKLNDLHEKYKWLIDFFEDYRKELKSNRNK